MLTVAVLRGGMVNTKALSLQTGALAISEFQELFRTLDVLVDKMGKWHLRGIPVSPERVLAQADVAFNALHGEYGEDGTVERILESSGIPYTGSKAYGAAVSLNKVLAKEILAKKGVRIPRHIVLTVSPSLEREARDAFRKFSPPIIVKPVSGSFSNLVSLAYTFDEFWSAVSSVFEIGVQVLVEEYIVGKEAVAGTVEDFRGKERYPLLPIEVTLPSRTIFDTEAKNQPRNFLKAPAGFSKEDSLEIERLSSVAHDALGLRHYSQSEFVLTPRGIYFIETNALPDLRKESAFGTSLKLAGASINEFMEHTVGLAAPRLYA